MAHIDPADIAVLQSLRDAMMACNSSHTQDFAHQSGAYGDVEETFTRVATKLLGDTGARRLLDLTIECGENIEYCLNQMYPVRKCYVALYDGPGQGTRAVRVFADGSDAADWVVNEHGAGVRWFEAVDYIPAKTAELPFEIEAELEMLASDMARMFSDLGYAAHGLDVDGNDILSALPAFLGAALAHARSSMPS